MADDTRPGPTEEPERTSPESPAPPAGGASEPVGETSEASRSGPSAPASSPGVAGPPTRILSSSSGSGPSRRGVLLGGAAVAGGGLALGLAALSGVGGGGGGTPTRPGATAPAGTPPAGWRDATRDHGAIGNGEGDDRAALQDAIDAAAIGGAGGLRGGVVNVGPGIYPISGSLFLRSGVTLAGAGPATVLRLLPEADEPALVVERNVDGTPVAYAAIRDLTLDGATSQQSSARHGIALRSNNSGSRTPYTGSDSFPLVANVLVVYFGGHGLAIGIDPPEGEEANVRGIRCVNVIVFECAKAAVDGDRAGFHVASSDGVFVACEAAACDGPGYEVVRANNRFESCKGYFNQDEFVVRGSRNQLSSCQAQDGFGDGFVLGGPGGVANLSLVGCQADSNAGAGFRLEGVTSSVLSGFTAFGRAGRPAGGPGVALRDTAGCVLSGTVSGLDVSVDGDNDGGVTQVVAT